MSGKIRLTATRKKLCREKSCDFGVKYLLFASELM